MSKNLYENNETRFEIEIDEDNLGHRLDQILSLEIDDLSRTRLKKLIEAGDVKINGEKQQSPSYKVQLNDYIVLDIPPPEPWYPEAENIPLNIIFEDDDLLVINKPAEIVVHPGAGNKNGTLVNALLHHCGDSLSGVGGVLRPGIVHRLDKDTSGLIVVAKNDLAHQGLSVQFSDRSLSRKYKALLVGIPMPPKGTVDLALARHHKNRLIMTVNEKYGKSARTHYTVLERYGEHFSLVECRLESGRTHQIRVHMQAIGHPLVGDQSYGAQPTKTESLAKKSGFDNNVISQIKNFPRQALHAYALSFVHPRSEEIMNFTCDLPTDFEDLVALLSKTNTQ